MNQSSSFMVEILRNGIVVDIHVEIRSSECVMSFLNIHLCTLLVLARSHSQCADLPVKFHWGSPHFSTSLLSPSSLTPLFITFFPSSSTEGREDLSLTWLTLPNDGQLSDEDSSFSRDQDDRLVVTSTLTCFRDKRWERRKSAVPCVKLETSCWCCLRMFWRCGGRWTPVSLIACSLPRSRFLSFFTWLRSEPTAGTFEFQDTFPVLIFYPRFVRDSLFVQTTWGLTKIGRRHLHYLTELCHFLKAPKSHGKG